MVRADSEGSASALTVTQAMPPAGDRVIHFTQFLLPDGRRNPIEIWRPASIADKADAIRDAGFRFECEVLSTGHVSLTITDDEMDRAIEIVANGPGVLAAVDRLIEGFNPAAAER